MTINTFANANVKAGKGRISKGNATLQNKIIGDVVDDANGNFEDDCEETTLKSSKQQNGQQIDEQHVYNEYPCDIWCLISEHIAPEDVGRFALINKQTFAITGSQKFWKCLYNRHYNLDVRLPTRLQPDCIVRPGGLRACVIRSLYYSYMPFVQRVVGQSKQDFHLLVQRRIDRIWFCRETDNHWLYFYKLKRSSMVGSRAAQSQEIWRKNPKSMKSLRNVFLNVEEGCSLLVVSAGLLDSRGESLHDDGFLFQIKTLKFHPLPKLSEEIDHDPRCTLSSIDHLLTRTCINYRLELKFSNASRHVVASVAYDPVISVNVYDWWTPNYYKYVNQGFQKNLEYLADEKEAIVDNDPDDDWDIR